MEINPFAPSERKNKHSAQQTINIAWWQTAADWVMFYIVTFHGKTYTTDNPLNIRLVVIKD